MNIEKAVKFKRETEIKILTLMKKFEEKTNLSVESLDVHSSAYLGSETQRVLTVKMEVKL